MKNYIRDDISRNQEYHIKKLNLNEALKVLVSLLKLWSLILKNFS